MILNDARGWAKATLPTYQDRKEFFEGIVNGDPDPVELIRAGREDEVRALIEAAKEARRRADSGLTAGTGASASRAIEVSEISLGSWLTYGAGVERDQTEACTRAAFDAGINFFDTSNIYGVGAAETAWGEILTDFDREDSYVLATKVFFPMSETDRGLSREQIHKQLDASLERLQTDYVDLYQCHRPDPETPIEETMEALTEVVRGGQGARDRLQRVDRRADRGRPRGPGREEVRLLPAAVQHDLAGARGRADPLLRRARDLADRLVAARPGRADRQVHARASRRPQDSRAASDEMSVGDRPLHGGRGARGRAAARADRRGRGTQHGPAGARLGAARRTNVASAIIGASRPEQVHANAEASGVELSQDVLDAIDEALDGVVDHRAAARRLRPGGRQAPLRLGRSAQPEGRA